MESPASASSAPHGSCACVCNGEPNTAENEDATATVGASADDDCSNPTGQNPPPASEPKDEDPEKLVNRGKKKGKKRPAKCVSASQSASSSSGSSQRGTRVAYKRRNARVVFAAARRNPVADAVSFRLGMSIAAFVAQVFPFFFFFFFSFPLFFLSAQKSKV